MSINWNFDKKKSNFNHKITEKTKVNREKIKAIFRIKTNLFEGMNNKIKEPIKGNNIKVDNKFELNIVVKKVNSKWN